jgi:translation initiation factor 5B
MKNEQEARTLKEFDKLIRPAKLKIMQGYVFRTAKPAVFGVDIQGTIKPKYPLIDADGQDLGEILQIQDKGKAVSEASTGMQVAISLEKPIVGRHINEGDTLYIKVPEAHAKAVLTKFQTRLTSQEQEALNEYVNLMRKKIPFWAA